MSTRGFDKRPLCARMDRCKSTGRIHALSAVMHFHTSFCVTVHASVHTKSRQSNTNNLYILLLCTLVFYSRIKFVKLFTDGVQTTNHIVLHIAIGRDGPFNGLQILFEARPMK